MIQSKALVVAHQKRLISKNFYSFSHIELRESGIENQEPFSHRTRKSALIIEGRVLFEPQTPLGELPIMSIVNPTLAHFRHFSSLYTNEYPVSSIVNPTLAHFRHFSSLYTNEYRVSRYESFLQNKPNLPAPQMNVNTVITKDYENEHLR